MAKKVRKSARTTRPSKNSKGLKCRVRMYRQGFGDCFLLSFSVQGKTRHMMIDCGLVTAASDGKKKLQAVLDDITTETNGRIDLLVVTHEHWDHVAGFHYFQDYFQGQQRNLEVDHVWLAWTEKPGDPLSAEIAEKKDRVGFALESAVQRLAATPGFSDAAAQARINGFGAFSKNSNSAMNFVRQLGVDRDEIDYLEPGELRPLPGVPGVRVYVLGPPRSDKLLRITNPRAGEGYADFGASAFMAAVASDASNSDSVRKYGGQQFPLDPKLRLTQDVVSELPADHDAQVKSTVDQYNDQDSAWRQIDDDWLRFGDGLALQMNSYTNNTSLVLAFELIESGQVLLFAADAQVGNWMSWWGFEAGQRADGVDSPSGKPLRWKLPAGQTSELDRDGDGHVTIDDVFRQTVLYKVGHHGSHNGTLGKFGLDRLGNADLVVMMPTNKKDAEASGWGEIPDEVLFRRIRTAARYRVFTSDSDLGVAADLALPADSQISAGNGWKAFRSRARLGRTHELLDGPLYVDYTL